LSFSGIVKGLVCLEAMGMRKGFEGLYAAVGVQFQKDVRGGALRLQGLFGGGIGGHDFILQFSHQQPFVIQ
jgi:hypothetical protein